MYVVDTSGKMFVIDRRSGRYHSSLSNGKAVVAAGTLEFDQAGNLLRITEDSGHYKFKDHIVIPVVAMRKMGVRLSKTAITPSPKARLSPSKRLLRMYIDPSFLTPEPKL